MNEVEVTVAISGGSYRVLREIDLHVGHGEILGLVGESGSGKSMLGKTIMGQLPGNAKATGEILLNGRDISGLEEESLCKLRGSELSMIYQDPRAAFNPTLRVGLQLSESLRIHKGLSKLDAAREVPGLLERVHLPADMKTAQRYPYEMSGGMLQRAMIASAIALQPGLIIADEPTTGLDVTTQQGILELFDEIRHEISASVILITHDLGVVAESCDRVAVMYAGMIVETGPAQTVLGEPAHPYTKALLDATPTVEANRELISLEGSVPPVDAIPDGCAFRPRCQYAQDSCHATPDSLRIADDHHAMCFFPLREVS